MLNYIHMIIALFASFIIGIVSISVNDDVNVLLIKVIITLIVFYFIGLVVKALLHKIAQGTDRHLQISIGNEINYEKSDKDSDDEI